MGDVERAIGEGDLELVVRHRAEMFRDAGRAEEILAAMEGPFRRWLAPRLADGGYCWRGTTEMALSLRKPKP